MEGIIDLSRFTEAHERSYLTALEEIGKGRKRTHWMWNIFPQIRGLGYSPASRYYAVRDLEEAAAFLRDPFLGGHLSEICGVLLELESCSAAEVFGRPDDMKLRSSMTLFSIVAGEDSVYQKVLDKFFEGKRDAQTLRILGL